MAINPATPASVLEEVLPLVDLVVKTVDPGFGHQLFLQTTLTKIERVRNKEPGPRRTAKSAQNSFDRRGRDAP